MEKITMSDVLTNPQDFDVRSRVKKQWNQMDSITRLVVQVAAVERGHTYADHVNNEHILPLWESHEFPCSPAGQVLADKSRTRNQSHISGELDLLIDGQ